MVTASDSIYLMGICGSGMGALAGLLKAQGHVVVGSDENVYPPMSDKLAQWGIPILRGYEPAHLDSKPSLVIVGNVIRATNPEAVAAAERGLRVLSMPQAIAEFGIADRHAIVLAGTHGKTTTSSLVSHLLMSAGRDPSFLVGGALVGYPESFRHGQGDFFVVEGDEYDTAYFDKGPKFLHYRAQTAVITSLEFDHADIFGDIGDVERVFLSLIESMPRSGHLVIWSGADRARALLKDGVGPTEVTIYATQPEAGANLYLKSFECGPDGLHFEPVLDGSSLGEMRAPLWGDFSAQNVLAAIGALKRAELTAEEFREGFATYAGVKRRMEVLGEPGGVVVVDDFGHHPTAIRLTTEAAKMRWPSRKVWAVFEPRSATSRRNILQQQFTEALSVADEVIIGYHQRLEEIDPADRFSPQEVAERLVAMGKEARGIREVDQIVATLVNEARRGDVVLLFSNGDFGGLHGRLVDALSKREGRA